jgi:hypothetical protein
MITNYLKYLQESQSSNFEIIPYKGVGPIRFSMNRNQVSQALNTKPKKFKKTPSSIADAFDFIGVHVFYDKLNKCEYIELSGGSGVTFKGQKLFKKGVNFLKSLSKKIKADEKNSLIFEDLGISITYSGNKIKSIGVFKKGYYK